MWFKTWVTQGTADLVKAVHAMEGDIEDEPESGVCVEGVTDGEFPGVVPGVWDQYQDWI